MLFLAEKKLMRKRENGAFQNIHFAGSSLPALNPDPPIFEPSLTVLGAIGNG
jgi:hypothetical protein